VLPHRLLLLQRLPRLHQALQLVTKAARSRLIYSKQQLKQEPVAEVVVLVEPLPILLPQPVPEQRLVQVQGQLQGALAIWIG
jgi:hypothetical protein